MITKTRISIVWVFSIMYFFFAGLGICSANEHSEFSDSIRKSPASKYIGKAMQYYSQQKLNEAVEEMKKAVQKDCKNPYIYSLLGQIYKDMCNYDKAFESYQEALRLKSNLLGALNGIGDVYRAKGNQELAEIYFKKVISSDPEYYAAYHNLGVLYEDMEKYIKAIECYNKAISINKNVYQSYVRLGYLYIVTEKYSDAIEIFKKYSVIRPDNYSTLYGLGLAYKLNGDLILAEETFRKAVSIKPDSMEAKQALEEIRKTRKERSEKIFALRKQPLSQTYVSDPILYSLSLQDVWKLQNEHNPVIFAAPGISKYGAALGVKIEPCIGGMINTVVINDLKNKIKSDNNKKKVNFIKEKEVTISKQKAYLIEYLFSFNNIKCKETEVLLVNKNMLFRISFASPDNIYDLYYPSAIKCIKSFKLLKVDEGVVLKMRQDFEKKGYHYSVNVNDDIITEGKDKSNPSHGVITVMPQYYKKGEIPISSTEMKLYDKYNELIDELKNMEVSEDEKANIFRGKVEDLIKKYGISINDLRQMCLKIKYGEIPADSYNPPMEVDTR